VLWRNRKKGPFEFPTIHECHNSGKAVRLVMANVGRNKTAPLLGVYVWRGYRKP
jgi:hypothetical protein